MQIRIIYFSLFCLFLLLFFFNAKSSIWAATYDEEEEEAYRSEKDIYLSDRLLKRKYIKEWNSIDGLIKAYSRASDIYDKVFLIERLAFFLSSDKAFNFILQAIPYEAPHYNGNDFTWKLRTSAIYLLGKYAISLPKSKQLIILKLARNLFKGDDHKRVIVASAITLARISGNSETVLSSSSHRLFKSRTISYLFSDKLALVKKRMSSAEDDYLVWGLAMASIILGDKNTYFALKEIRKKKFSPVVLSTIDRALKKLK